MTVEPLRDINLIAKIQEILKSKNLRDWLMFVIGCNTNLRISDILKLRIGDIISPTGKVRTHIDLIEKKTGKRKRIKLNDKIKDAVTEYVASLQNYTPEDYLFRSRKGENKPISKVQAYRIIKQAAKEAGIEEHVGTHTMRKTHGYHAYQATKDIALLMDLFNHSSPQITLRYLGINQERRDEIYDKIQL